MRIASPLMILCLTCSCCFQTWRLGCTFWGHTVSDQVAEQDFKDIRQSMQPIRGSCWWGEGVGISHGLEFRHQLVDEISWGWLNKSYGATYCCNVAQFIVDIEWLERLELSLKDFIIQICRHTKCHTKYAVNKSQRAHTKFTYLSLADTTVWGPEVAERVCYK